MRGRKHSAGNEFVTLVDIWEVQKEKWVYLQRLTYGFFTGVWAVGHKKQEANNF